MINAVTIPWENRGRTINVVDQGNSRTISRSNIKNITATRKNLIEKGAEGELNGVKPHS